MGGDFGAKKQTEKKNVYLLTVTFRTVGTIMEEVWIIY